MATNNTVLINHSVASFAVLIILEDKITLMGAGISAAYVHEHPFSTLLKVLITN